jgi:uncharacterized protein
MAMLSRRITLAVILMTGIVLAGCSKKGAAGSLIDAACAGDVAEVERLVKLGIPVDGADGQGDTALNWAIHCCKPDVVRKLIELGANVNHLNHRANGRFAPLIYTAWAFRGKNLSGTQEERNRMARLLIQNGADVKYVMDDGNTALHFAVRDRNPELIHMLLAAGADANVKTHQGYTPLDIAKFPDYAPNEEVIRLLEKASAP